MPVVWGERSNSSIVPSNGDLLIRTLIDIPKKLTKRQEELLRELAEIDQKHVSTARKGFFDKVKEWLTGGVEEKKEGAKS